MMRSVNPSPLLRLGRTGPIFVRSRITTTRIQSLLRTDHVSRSCSSSSSSTSSSTSTTTTTTTTTTNGPFNHEAYLQRATQRLASQQPTTIPDTLSPTQSHLLTLSLAHHCPDLFPQQPSPFLLDGRQPPRRADGALPQGHHLVYFPPQLPPAQLMPDGTDSAHWPGGPFVRRMWAGGEVVFEDGWEAELRLDNRRAACVESVGRPEMKGVQGGGGGGGGGSGSGSGGGKEKVFVDVTRRYGVAEEDRWGLGENRAVVREVRRLVFMREVEGAEGSRRKEEGRKGVRVTATPEFTFTLRPDATLLFHFSALTYNAHRIHLDPDYAVNREGYKGLLVHGPLTLVLMFSALRAALFKSTEGALAPDAVGPKPYVKSINYRNLAPLYVDEDLRICLRRARTRDAEVDWDVWIEGPDGGLAVKASAVTKDPSP
ncbi:hypothetical protein VTK26DRAFT_7253 [Humicola hyalothermophila]